MAARRRCTALEHALPTVLRPLTQEIRDAASYIRTGAEVEESDVKPHTTRALVALGALTVAGAAAAATAPPAIDEAAIRRAIESHYATAADPQTVALSSELYADDAVLEFPQGGERIRGKANIVAFRTAYPARVMFDLRRTVGQGDLWVNEGVIRYDGARPHHFVGIMEWRAAKVVRETIYFGEPWTPPAWRARWVEPLE